MKKIITLALLLSNALQSMEKPSGWVRNGDFIGIRVIHFPEADDAGDEHMTQQEEFNEQYFCSDLAATATYDDSSLCSKIRKSLFIQLCMQAAKRVGAYEISFHELLEKIKSNYSEHMKQNTNFMFITKKDMSHRLLMGIPTGHTHALVNGKAVKLYLNNYETEQDAIENEKIKKTAHAARPATPPQKWKWGVDLEPKSQPRLTYSGEILRANYHFESDPKHHEKIVKEFKELLK